VQPSLDLGPTLLGFFGVEATADMLGHDLASTVRDDTAVRDAAIFGYFGDRVNLTDGRYTYHHAPAKLGPDEAFHYTLMPTQMRGFKPNLDRATLAEPFGFSKHMPLLRIPASSNCARAGSTAETLLYDTHADPQQRTILDDEAQRRRCAQRMAELMVEADAPAEQFERLGLTRPS
jgi:hypothetical protein